MTMLNVLFVDDEPDMLKGLRNLFRRDRERWSMSFADSGAGALAELEAHPVDVIVSDMRMPEMDGATLLALVRDRYPAVRRIILSGYANPESMALASEVAHSFLAKPCEARVLRQTIDSLGRIEEPERMAAGRRE